MHHAPWLKTVAFALAALCLLSGVAGADPTGSANVIQILNVRTLKGIGGSEQRTFLTTDPITFEATYYDPNPPCAGVAPSILQLLLFNLEGQLLFTFIAGSEAFSEGSKSRLLFADLNPNILPAGDYQHVFLVRDCTGVNIVVSEPQTIRVVGASAFPDLRGTYAVAGTVTQSICPNPIFNNTFVFTGDTLTITTQDGPNFSGTGQFMESISGVTVRVDLIFVGMVNASGQLSGNLNTSLFFNNVFSDSSTATINGSFSGNTISITASGQVLGSACTFTASLSGSR